MTNNNTIVEVIQGTIKIIKYNKPSKKNAIDMEMYKHITRILDDTARDTNITVAVVTGIGDFFSSGADLTYNRDSYNVTILKNFIESFINFPKTLIAIVNGPAIGIAATTLALFDLVFANENAYFYTPFTKLGMVAEGCSTYTFPRLLGERKAIEMLMFNHKMSAAEALECGFVNYLYKPEDLQTKVWDKIIEISKLPKNSMLASKRLLRNNNRMELLQVNEKELKALENVWASEEYIHAIMASMNSSKKKSNL